jgi:2-succinyl-5-enolpyruvyl-6-hydroxy-3-cyclohexene-1-carboxylate synthase
LIKNSIQYSDKQSVADLVQLCSLRGIRYAVISPGSRNAPLSITFNRHPDIKTIVIPDERVAGFVALGLAQQTGILVVLCCTSGSASLNYAPAIAEAYYQRIPLLVVTADRPVELVDQGDGQTIRQKNVYHNFIRKSIELIQDATSMDDIALNRTYIQTALNDCMLPIGGPVHINFPLSEPLYNTASYESNQLPKHFEPAIPIPNEIDVIELSKNFNAHQKVLVVCGLMPPNKDLQEALARLAAFPQVVVLTETTSNLNHPLFFPCIDRLIFTFNSDDLEEFRPSLLITVGVQIISKKIKAILRERKPKHHWHIDADNEHPNTFQALTHSIKTAPEIALRALFPFIYHQASNYQQWVRNRDKAIDFQHDLYMKDCAFSDLKAVESVLENLPSDANLHLGNSASVRYVQLFKQGRVKNCNANRGTSGIDGCNSTAIGAAMVNNCSTVLLTGDMAFLYDSNAFWQQELPSNLKIIIINNAGGGIFRIIDGPSDEEEITSFFEAHHSHNALKIAEMYNLNYYSANTLEALNTILSKFLSTEAPTPSILEIFTPRLENAKVLKSYFQKVKTASTN